MISYQHGWFIHFESKLLLGKSGDSRQYEQNGSNLRRSQKSTFLRLLICHFWPIFALAQTRKQCLYPDANSRICRYVHAFSLCQTLESKRFFLPSNAKIFAPRWQFQCRQLSNLSIYSIFQTVQWQCSWWRFYEFQSFIALIFSNRFAHCTRWKCFFTCCDLQWLFALIFRSQIFSSGGKGCDTARKKHSKSSVFFSILHDLFPP